MAQALSPQFLFPTPPSQPVLTTLSFGPIRAGHPLSGIDSKDSPTAGLTEMSKLDLNRPFRTPLRGLLERGLVGAGGYSPADRKHSWGVGSFTCTHPTSSLAHKAADCRVCSFLLHTFHEFGAPLHSVSFWFSQSRASPLSSRSFLWICFLCPTLGFVSCGPEDWSLLRAISWARAALGVLSGVTEGQDHVWVPGRSPGVPGSWGQGFSRKFWDFPNRGRVPVQWSKYPQHTMPGGLQLGVLRIAF